MARSWCVTHLSIDSVGLFISQFWNVLVCTFLALISNGFFGSRKWRRCNQCIKIKQNIKIRGKCSNQKSQPKYGSSACCWLTKTPMRWSRKTLDGYRTNVLYLCYVSIQNWHLCFNQLKTDNWFILMKLGRHSKWVLETRPQSFTRATCTFYCWDITSAPGSLIFEKVEKMEKECIEFCWSQQLCQLYLFVWARSC